MNWLSALSHNAAQNISCILVTVIDSEGSAPRVQGTRLVVTENNFVDTLGGGSLEHEAIAHARELLSAKTQSPLITNRQFILGSDLTQCCGGRVTLQFDCHWANDFILHVFGAGHVAQALVRVLVRVRVCACARVCERVRHMSASGIV